MAANTSIQVLDGLGQDPRVTKTLIRDCAAGNVNPAICAEVGLFAPKPPAFIKKGRPTAEIEADEALAKISAQATADAALVSAELDKARAEAAKARAEATASQADLAAATAAANQAQVSAANAAAAQARVPGMSTTTKVLIGGAAVAGVGLLLVLARRR